MSDIRVKVGQENTIKSRVGQQNTVKVVSSVSGSAGGSAVTSENVIGGIASVTSLSVSGVSTFVGVSTFKNDVYIDGDLYISDDLVFDEFTARNINVTGIASATSLYVSGVSTLTQISAGGTTGPNQYVLSSTGTGLSWQPVTSVGAGTLNGIIVQEEGSIVGTAGSITTLNFKGSNITVTGVALGIAATITVSDSPNFTALNVTGVSTFVGVSTFKNDVYIDGDLYISDDLVFDEFTARNANITGILTVGQSIYYPIGQPYGVAYFDLNDQLVSTGTTASAISETNYILTTDNSGIPTWSGVIDGGTY